MLAKDRENEKMGLKLSYSHKDTSYWMPWTYLNVQLELNNKLILMQSFRSEKAESAW